MTVLTYTQKIAASGDHSESEHEALNRLVETMHNYLNFWVDLEDDDAPVAGPSNTAPQHLTSMSEATAQPAIQEASSGHSAASTSAPPHGFSRRPTLVNPWK